MAEIVSKWAENPVTYLVALAAAGAVFAAGRWVGNVNTDRSAFREFMEEVKTDIKQILSRLPPPTPVAGKSPLQITEFGEKIVASMNAKGWANNLAATLLNEVRGKEEFEVYQFALNYVQLELTEEWQRNVAIAAYEFAIEEDAVRRVLAVVLRDKLLQLLSSNPPRKPAP